MLSRLSALLRGAGDRPGSEAADPEREARLGAVCLMLEAAEMDGSYSADERTQIALTLGARYGLDGEQAQAVIDEARAELAASEGLYPLARRIRDHAPAEDRAEIIEMLWGVALADGVLDPLEDQLIRRVAGLIGVTDQERGEARKRAEAAMKN